MLLLLDRVIRGIVRGAEILSGLILVLSIGINFVNIVGRYAFHSPIPWAEEVMLYLMLALVFLGAGMSDLPDETLIETIEVPTLILAWAGVVCQ